MAVGYLVPKPNKTNTPEKIYAPSYSSLLHRRCICLARYVRGRYPVRAERTPCAVGIYIVLAKPETDVCPVRQALPAELVHALRACRLSATFCFRGAWVVVTMMMGAYRSCGSTSLPSGCSDGTSDTASCFSLSSRSSSGSPGRHALWRCRTARRSGRRAMPRCAGSTSGSDTRCTGLGDPRCRRTALRLSSLDRGTIGRSGLGSGR